MQSKADRAIAFALSVLLTIGGGLLIAYLSQPKADRDRRLLSWSWWLLGALVIVGVLYYLLWPALTALAGVRAGWIQRSRARRAVTNRNRNELLKAEYGSGDVWIDVTDLVRGFIASGRTNFLVTNDLMGDDPVFGQLKQLKLVYNIDGIEQPVEYNEGTLATLPVP
ncbi:MAG TPA: hypothetical protein VNQ73_16520 [Ilumatobacter sp.]|nr:hypothetical protein [Ilumatobacter sp.]